MTNTKTTNKDTTTITADFSMPEKFNTLVADGMTTAEALATVNNMVKNTACNVVITADGIKWDKLIDGVVFEQLDENGNPATKTLKVADLFILKANKNSTKTIIDGNLYAMLECFGANIHEAELTALDDDTLVKIKVYSKYIPSLECFTEETRISNNSLERQFTEFLIYFLGDTAPQAKKTYVKHLKRQYVTANKNGYRNGNALTLLQLVINHAYDCKHNIQYAVKSGLASHKAPKENK